MNKQSINTFIEGLKSDQHPLQTSPQAMTDMINGTNITGKGDDLIQQALKSNRPVVSDRSVKDSAFYHVTAVSGTFTLDSLKEIHELYFISHQQIVTNGAFITFTVNYNSGDPDVIRVELAKVVPGDQNRIFFEPFSIGGRKVYNIVYTISGVVSIAADTLSLYATYYGEHVVGLPKGNKVLGIKTHNDVAYIVSGRRANKVYEKTDQNNVSGKPYDLYNSGNPVNAMVRDAGVNRTMAISPDDKLSEKINFFTDFSNSGVFITNSTVQGSNIQKSVMKLSAIGPYAFEIRMESQISYSNNIDEHWVNMKLAYKTPGGSLTYINGGSWDIAENNNDSAYLQRTKRIYFTSTQIGTEIILVGECKAKDRGRIKLDVDAYITLVDKPFSVVSGNGLELDVSTTVKATSSLHIDGSITIRKKQNGDSGTYKVVLDYNDNWISLTEGGSSYTFSGLSEGKYNVYVWKETRGEFAVFPFTVGSSKLVEDMKLTATILAYRSIHDMDVKFYLEDSSDYHGYRTYNLIKPDGQIVSMGSITYDKTKIYTGFDAVTDGLLTFEVEDADYYWNSVATPIRRKVQVQIPVSDDLLKRNYYVEVGTFPSPDYLETKGSLQPVYRPINNLNSGPFICKELFLSGKTYLEMELQPSYDGSINIIYSDGETRPRLINSGFAVRSDNQYEIIERIGSKDTNKYTGTNVEVTSRLVQSVSEQVKLDVRKINCSGGKLPVGMYKYFFTLGTADGNETDFVEESGMVPIFHGDTIGTVRGGKAGEETSKSVEIVLKNVDTSFNHVSVYFLIHSGNEVNTTLAYKISKKYLIPSSEFGDRTTDMAILHSGFELLEQISEQYLSEQKHTITAMNTLAQIQNRLFVANTREAEIDYKTLVELGRRIVATPSMGNKYITMGSLYDKWTIKPDTDLSIYSHLFYTEPINNLLLPDINLIKGTSFSNNIFSTLYSQGFHNPLVVEKYASYWPKETYAYKVCFILDNDEITNPVPVIGGDYIDKYMSDFYGTVPNDMYTTGKSLFTQDGSNNWEKGGDVEYNKIGVLRFPQQAFASTAFYPKFKFNKENFKDVDPAIMSRIKGFFFVRAERKPDLIMQGVLGRCGYVITESPAFDPKQDLLSTTDKPSIVRLPDVDAAVKSAIPTIVGGSSLVLVGHELIDRSNGKITGATYQELQENAATFVRSMYSQDVPFSYIEGGKSIYKYWFKSADMYADLPRVAASFNGNSFGLNLFGSFLRHFIYTSKMVDGLSRYKHVLMTLSNYEWQAPSSSLFTKIGQVKGIADFVDYGQPTRSGGGFASKIGFRAGRNMYDINGVVVGSGEYDKLLQPTGNYTPYIGFTLTSTDGTFPLGIGLVDIYPNEKWVTTAALKDMYASDEGDVYIPITPRYTFDDFKETDEIEVIGTRGDCFISYNTFNVARSLPAVSKNPASDQPNFEDEGGEYNSYRSDDGSMNVGITHASNYLGYARHPEVKDEVESALYNKARSFMPLNGAGDKLIGVSRGNKLPETSAFNKGYKSHFTGRKYAGISSEVPYISKMDTNTITFSEPFSESSFYNGYRDFVGLNKRNYSKELGAITKILNYKGNLLAVHQKGINYIGINDQTFAGENTSGQVIVKNSEVMNPKPMTISDVIGSRWKRSVLATDNYAYGVDVDNNAIWMMEGNNVEIISANAVSRILDGFLTDFRNKEEIPGELYIATFYDKSRKDVYFTFYNKNSRYTDIPLPMDVDIFYMLDNMADDAARTAWITSLNMADEKLRRKELVEKYNMIRTSMDIHPELQNYLTLVWNEDNRQWKTRKNYSPEFMFNLGNSLYSVNNIDTASMFTTDHVLYDVDCTERQLIWEHYKVHKDLAPYGSFYGKDPVFEIEFVVNKDSAVMKDFLLLMVEGDESMPAEVIYQLSGNSTALKQVLDTSNPDNAYNTFDAMKEGFTNRIIANNIEQVNPNFFVRQEVFNRYFHSIIKANYVFVKGINQISIGKNLDLMYHKELDGTYTRKKRALSHMKDNYIKVRLRYNNGKHTTIKAIYTNYVD